MTTSRPNPSSELSKALENLAEARASVDPEMVLWHEASKLLNEMKIPEAALKAAQACGKDLLEDPMQGMILDEISNLAVINKLSGPETESMWISAAEYGRHDLAYNAANEIISRANSVADYKLASRYYQMAIKGSGPISLRASAIANSAEIVREGLITGKKDWLGAISLYEESANMGLLQGMFNAGNVLLWLVASGNAQYAERAASWFKKVIKIVEDDTASIDLGGQAERPDLLKNARICLAQMHLDGVLEGSSFIQFEKLVSDYGKDSYVQSMYKKYRYLSLVRASAKPGESAADNWISVLKLLGWKVRTKIAEHFGEFDGVSVVGARLLIDTGEQELLVMLVFDDFASPGSSLEGIYGAIALAAEKHYNAPVFYACNKAFFVQFKGHAFSVLQVAHNQKLDVTPIWPGSTVLDVYSALFGDIDDRFKPEHDDSKNSIPRLVNALDEGVPLNGHDLPNAIWLRVGSILCMPIHRPEEPERIGLESNPKAYLKEALDKNLNR